MRKIIFDATPLIANKTGVAYYTERLVLAIAAEYKNEVELVGFYYNFLGRHSVAHLPKRPNIRYTYMPLLPAKVLHQLRRWGIEIPIEILARQRADFILYPNFLGWPSLFHTPNAPVIHDLTYLDLPQYVTTRVRGDLTRFVPKTIARANFVITVSEFSKQRIAKNYRLDPNKILVTHIPPEAPHKLANAERRAHLQALGLDGKHFILFVGTVEPRKNLLTLLDAYTRLPADIQNKTALVIAGGIGWHCQAEQEKMTQLQGSGVNIIHLGYVDDIARAALYQSAALFVSASKYEGFGMPTLEAMSYGTPCALSDIPVFHEVAGDAALYFNPTDPADASRQMHALLRNTGRAQAMREKGLARAATYRWDVVARQVMQQIEAALSAKGSGA